MERKFSFGQQETIRSLDLSGEEMAFHFQQHAAKLLLALKTNNKILVKNNSVDVYPI